MLPTREEAIDEQSQRSPAILLACRLTVQLASTVIVIDWGVVVSPEKSSKKFTVKPLQLQQLYEKEKNQKLRRRSVEYLHMQLSWQKERVKGVKSLGI